MGPSLWSNIMYYRYFLPYCGFPFHFLIEIFQKAIIFNFNGVQFNIFFLMVNALSVLKVFAYFKAEKVFFYILF